MLRHLRQHRTRLFATLIVAGTLAVSYQASAAQTYQPSGTVSQPLPGNLLIADRGNDRLLVVTPDKRIVWSMPIRVGGPKGVHSHGADDGFFTPDHKHIIVSG